MTTEFIPFNRPYATDKELVYVAEAQRNDHLSGDGSFTKRCHQWIEQQTGCDAKALLTHSFTSALDLAALLLDIKSGDEVILASYCGGFSILEDIDLKMTERHFGSHFPSGDRRRRFQLGLRDGLLWQPAGQLERPVPAVLCNAYGKDGFGAARLR